jgi:hypothetical protein
VSRKEVYIAPRDSDIFQGVERVKRRGGYIYIYIYRKYTLKYPHGN